MSVTDTRQYRIQVQPGTAQFMSKGTTVVCIQLLDHTWTLYRGTDDDVRRLWELLKAELPEAMAHLQMQTRDVTAWANV